jgi:hypothetical protein
VPKMLMLTVSLMLLTAGLNAQGQTSGQKQVAPPGKISVQGCLQGRDGNYALISDSGTTYHLFGKIPNLSVYLGHEVRITGSSAGGGASSSEMSPTSVQVLKVGNVQYISETCGEGTSGKRLPPSGSAGQPLLNTR